MRYLGIALRVILVAVLLASTVGDSYAFAATSRAKVKADSRAAPSAPAVYINIYPDSPDVGTNINFNAVAGGPNVPAIKSITIYVDTDNPKETCTFAGTKQDAVTCNYQTAKLQRGYHTYWATATDVNGKVGKYPATGKVTFYVGTTWTMAVAVKKLGTGTGTVTGPGIDCGSDCDQEYEKGITVTLYASPDYGSTFEGWSGPCSGKGACTLTMDKVHYVDATFNKDPTVPTTATLTVQKYGNGLGTITSSPSGIIDCGLDCEETFGINQNYALGQTVTLTANPAAENSFAGWGGFCSGYGTALTCTIKMDGDRTVSAMFGPKAYISVAKLGAGTGTVTSSPSGINCGPDCDDYYTSGTNVVLTAKPALNSTFSGWSGACSGAALNCTIPARGIKLAFATFSIKPKPLYVLSVISSRLAGTIRSDDAPAKINCGITCDATYEQGSVVTLTAATNPGYVFLGWNSPTCAGTGSCTVIMSNAQTVRADFNRISVSHTPTNPTSAQPITFRAASGGTDLSGIKKIDIYIDYTATGAPANPMGSGGMSIGVVPRPAQTCTFSGAEGAVTCNYTAVIAPGQHTYFATATDVNNNIIRSSGAGFENFDVQDVTPPTDITGLGETETGPTWINWQWTNPGDADLDHIEVWLNNTFRANISANSYNATGLTSDTGYEIEIRPVDTTGNIGNWATDSARTTIPPDVTPPADITGLGETEVGTTWINWQWTNPADADLDHIEVWLDNAFQANITTNSYNATGLLEGTQYEIEVRPVDTTGNIGNWETDTATTQANTLPVITLVSPANNTLTNDTTPDSTFYFIDTENSTATCSLYYNATLDGSANAQNNTNTVITASQKANGIYDWYVTCDDGVGTTTSETWRILINGATSPNTAPTVTVTSPANNTVFNTNNNLSVSFYFTDTEQIAGSAQLFVNGTLYDSIATAFNNTAYTLNANNLSNGTYTFEVNASDETDVGSSGLYTFTIDIRDVTAPADITGLGETAVATSWINWQWTNPADADLDHIEVWLNDTFLANQSANSYNATGLNEGTLYEMGVRPVDASGNIGNWANDTATTLTQPIDTLATIAVINQTNNTLTNSNQNWPISFSAIDNENSTIDCSIFGNSTASTGSVSNSTVNNWTLAIVEGINNWYISCGDSNMNATTGIYTLTLDSIAPGITFNEPTANNTTIVDPFMFANLTTNESATGATLEWNGTNYSMSGSGTDFYLNVTGLVNGNYTFKAYATDTAGNTGISEERWVEINATNDNAAPATVTGLNETATGTTWILWNWTNPSDNDFSHVEIYLGGLFYANVTSMNASSINVTGLTPATLYTIGTRTVDVFGNINTTFVNDTATTLGVPPQPPAPSEAPGRSGGGGTGGGGPTTLNGYVLEVPPGLVPKNVTPSLPALTLAGNNIIDVTAGVPYTLKLDVKNEDGINDYYGITILEGPDWVTLNDIGLSVGKKETKQFTATILAPLGTSGSFPLRVQAASVNNPGVFTTYDLTIRVKPQAAAAGGFITGFITFVGGTGRLAALVGAALLAGLGYIYWRSRKKLGKKPESKSETK